MRISIDSESIQVLRKTYESEDYSFHLITTEATRNEQECAIALEKAQLFYKMPHGYGVSIEGIVPLSTVEIPSSFFVEEVFPPSNLDRK